jgi:hypothetical protein
VYVARKLLASAVAVAATVVVPTVLGAVRPPGPALHVARGFVATRGSETADGRDLANLSIGVPVGVSLTIANTGTLSADYRLDVVARGDRLFLDDLVLIAHRRSDGSMIFFGPIARLQTLPLGRFASGAFERRDMQITLAPTGSQLRDDRLQGRSASVAFSRSATEA